MKIIRRIYGQKPGVLMEYLLLANYLFMTIKKILIEHLRAFMSL